MATDNPHSQSPLQDETALRWGFLEDESEACVVVSDRMELVYINAAGRTLVPAHWFGKRCFEVLPVVNESCAWHCPTILAVSESVKIVYCEETVLSPSGSILRLGVGAIPVATGALDPAKSVLLLRPKEAGCDEDTFRRDLLLEAEGVRARIAAHLG